MLSHCVDQGAARWIFAALRPGDYSGTTIPVVEQEPSVYENNCVC